MTTVGDLLELRRLVAGYGTLAVVHGIDLRVAEGEMVALLGANGAGKTTTLLTISGLLRPIEGEVVLLGQVVNGLAPHVVARRGIAHVPEDRALFSQLTVAENLRLGAPRGRGGADHQVLDFFPELTRLHKRAAGLLSGGEQQMLAIARALVGRPRLLIVDEMSLGLAPVVVLRLLPVLTEIAHATGVGVLYVEQHVPLALEQADRAYVMSRGRITLEGRGDELRGRLDLLQASYLGAAVPSGS